MKCKNFCKLISEYIDGELDAKQKDLAEKHLLECPNCMSLLETMKKTIYYSKKIYKVEEVPGEIIKNIYVEIQVIYEKKYKK
ncbi:anti-sigma factor [bacterium]|nr:anti-sigma factor [bacterium]